MPVYLLGAGPGDPSLITVKGAEIMKQADAVVYDRLANFPGGILELAPPHAEKINVGKTPNPDGGEDTRVLQQDINALLVELAQKHAVVVRLKGGDPFVFARGGEEVEALANAGVSFEIIPGISSPIAVPAYAGIPLTLRHSSTSFTVITGHEDPATAEFVDWEAAAKLGGTLVILMGVARWDEIAGKLRQANMAPDTPVAAIRWGTRPNQTTVRGTLSTVKASQLEPPMVIVVGKVAASDFSWFESQPLFGKKILVTRPQPHANIMAQQIFQAGGEPVVVPLIEILKPSDEGKGLAQGLGALGVGDWLICTSANGVRYLFDLLKDARQLGGLKVAAIGTATAEEFIKYNIVPDLVPEEFVGEALVAAFPQPTRQQQKVLIASAQKAKDVVPEGLTQKGYEVLVRTAYKTQLVTPTPEQLEVISQCDVVTFASPSVVSSFVALDIKNPPKVVACIGPVTEEAANQAGLNPVVVASQHSSKGLIDALGAHFS